MSTLTSLDDFKIFLGETGSADDTKLQLILDSVESAIEQWCKRTFAEDTYTEFYDGGGGKLLSLDHRPATAITGLWVDQDGYYGSPADAFPDSGEWIEGTDFAMKRSDQSEKNGSLLVALRGTGNIAFGYFPCGDGNIKVTYTAGYDPIPDDLALATWLLGMSVRNAADNGVAGALQSETQGRYSYTILASGQADFAGEELSRARSILRNYREVVA